MRVNRRPSVDVACFQCGLIHSKSQNQVDRSERVFCSDKCSRLYRKLNSGGSDQTCKQCGKVFWRPKSRTPESGGCFCSSECRLSWVFENVTKKSKREQSNRVVDEKEYNYHRQRYLEKKSFVDALKLETGCKVCGYKEFAAALEFDHVRGEKKTNIGWLVCAKESVILEETAKCDVLCGNCHRIKTSELWNNPDGDSVSAIRRRSRRVIIEEFKSMLGCVDCGYNKNPVALDFDHVSGVKDKAIAKLLLCGWQKIQEEIDKCEVVCVNCHRVRTAKRRETRKFNQPATVAACN